MTRFSFILLFIVHSQLLFAQLGDDYHAVIRENGLPPIDFVQKKLDEYDLVIFDDALH